jgi:hypothetical protein
MKNCIIGYTGFVGTNILNNNKIQFDEFYNTKNIDDIKDNYNIILFTGLSGNVGYVNKNYENDLKNINFFIEKLKNINCNKFILISTINVYPNLNNKNTENEILELKNSIDYYGKHRLLFEQFIINRYNNYHILRLPSIYGINIKKGILFDLINKNYLENICLDDEIQFYDLKNINDDIEYVCNNNIKILNLVSEPIYVYKIINDIFPNYKIINNLQLLDTDTNNIINIKERNAKKLDICSQYYNKYIYNTDISLKKIKEFIENKLLLLIPLYNIKKHMFETNVNNNLYNSYENMFKISYLSYLKYNNDIIIKKITNNNELNNFGDMFKDIVKKIINIHFFEKRDILYVESDTLCLGKINLKNIDKLLMFNMGSGECDLFNIEIMMNSGVIYIPKNCKLDYDFTINLYNNTNFNDWINFEKFWNILYYNQFSNYEESIKYNKYIGKYNYYKTYNIPNNYISNIRSLDFFNSNYPNIIHLCGSRGSNQCLEIMNNLKELNLIEHSEIIYNNLPIL